MGNILNPTENNSFIKLVKFKDSEIFVDKTDFIEKISAKVNTQNNFFSITRPRRFGKTVTATCYWLTILKDTLDRIFLTN